MCCVNSNVFNFCDIETLIWCVQLRPLVTLIFADLTLSCDKVKDSHICNVWLIFDVKSKLIQ